MAEDDDEGTTIRRRFLLGTGRRSIIYRSIIGGGPMTSQSRRRPASHFYSGRRRTPKWRPFFSLTPRDGRESFALTLTSATATKSIKRRRRRDVTTAATVPVSWLVKAKKKTKQTKQNKTQHETAGGVCIARLGARARAAKARNVASDAHACVRHESRRPTHTYGSDAKRCVEGKGGPPLAGSPSGTAAAPVWPAVWRAFSLPLAGRLSRVATAPRDGRAVRCAPLAPHCPHGPPSPSAPPPPATLLARVWCACVSVPVDISNGRPCWSLVLMDVVWPPLLGLVELLDQCRASCGRTVRRRRPFCALPRSQSALCYCCWCCC